jgi:hypothetical protein
MPPERSLKRKDRPSQARREELAERICATGFDMLPCSSCERNNRSCVLSSEEGSGRCSECVRRGVKCDVEGIPVGDWRSLAREEARLKAEEAAAFQLMRDSMARVERLKKQQEFLKKKGVDMLRRGLRTMDELEAVEEREKQEGEERARREAATTVPDQPAPDPYDFDALALDQAFWAEMGSAGGNSQASQGN